MLGAFGFSAAQAIITNLFPAVDPNNKVEAFLLCNAMVNVDCINGANDMNALSNGRNPEWYTPASASDSELNGRTRYVFEQAATKFKGTTLGGYCQLALKAKRREGGALFLYGI